MMKRMLALALAVLMLCASLPAMAYYDEFNWVDCTVEIPTGIDMTKPLPDEDSIPRSIESGCLNLWLTHAMWYSTVQGDAMKDDKRSINGIDFYPCYSYYHTENPVAGEIYCYCIMMVLTGGLDKVTTNNRTMEHKFYQLDGTTYMVPLVFGELNADGTLTEIQIHVIDPDDPDSDSLDGLDYLDDETDWLPDETEEELSVPQTGDSMPVALLLGAMLLSAVCAVIIVKRRRV